MSRLRYLAQATLYPPFRWNEEKDEGNDAVVALYEIRVRIGSEKPQMGFSMSSNRLLIRKVMPIDILFCFLIIPGEEEDIAYPANN